MNLLEVIQRLLGRHTPPSASTARQRLQLVLAHDRSDLNPELLDQMRREILAVVQRYVEIDLDGFDVSLETEERVTALVANVPIKRTLAAPPAHTTPEGSESGQGNRDPEDTPGLAGPTDTAIDPNPAPVPAWLRAREARASGDGSPAEGSGELVAVLGSSGDHGSGDHQADQDVSAGNEGRGRET